jgi:predicted Rossmann fold nucleotide-binding protein DprA/Smf involved in DNA uptake
MADAADVALARLMLFELPRVGEQTVRRLLELARDQRLELGDVLRFPAPLLASRCRLPAAAIERLTIDREPYTRHCQMLLARAHQIGADLCTLDDAEYPRPWLRHTLSPPPLVYVHGAAAALAAPAVALLSSREPSAPSVSATVRLIEGAAGEGFTLVAGGMKSTHRIAAATARASGALRVIVLDRGLLSTFPDGLPRDSFGFGPCRPALDTSRTLVLSPFRLYDHAVPRNGRRRDQLAAALGDLIVAVSARPGGEIERICLEALDRGRCVLSWHGENRGLVAAGAIAIDESDVRAGLRRFLAKSSQ